MKRYKSSRPRFRLSPSNRIRGTFQRISGAHSPPRSTTSANASCWTPFVRMRSACFEPIFAAMEATKPRHCSRTPPTPRETWRPVATLAARVVGFSKDPQSETPLEDLQKAATELQAAGDAASSRQLLDFVYTQHLDSPQFRAATFLGLAEIRLAQGDTKTAVALL